MITTSKPVALAGSLCVLLAGASRLTAGTYSNDFSAGADDLTIYTLAGNPPEVRASGGNPDGYLKLTDAENGTTSTVIFPDLDGGFRVSAFTFDIDCRIGNGSDVPADGFSISFAGLYDDTLDDGAGFNAGAAEEGTPTGLSIGFDTYNNGNGDVVGFSIKRDGVIVQEFPAPTLNGDLTDPTSLETGPIGSAGWAHLKVEMKAGGLLDLTWKGVKLIEDLVTGWEPMAGRIVFGARTGGLNAAHHFDNLSLTTTPEPVAALTSSVARSTGYTFEISDFAAASVVTPADIDTVVIDGASVTPTSVTKSGTVTTITYNPVTPLTSRSTHTFEIAFQDQTAANLVYSGQVTTPILPAGDLLPVTAEESQWNIAEVVVGGPIEPFDIGRAADIFALGNFFNTGVAPYINFSDPQNGGAAGLFRADQPFLSNTDGDDNDFIDGANLVINITGTTPAELQRSFWVHSDDGFALRIKNATFINKAGPGLIDPASSDTLAFLAGTGDSNTRGLCQFPAAGAYVVELLHFEGSGGASNELSWTNGDYINNTNGAVWSLVGGTLENPVLPTPLPPTPTGATAGQWNVREIRGDYGGSLASAIAFAGGDLSGATVTDGTSPVINFNDLDGVTGLPGRGLFNNDLPYIGDQPGDDNDLIMVARATISIPAAGLYTVGAFADDGWALTVPGAWFVNSSGPGALDPKTTATLRDTVYHDSPTLGVLNVPAAGDYDVFFLVQEGGGGSGWEIFYAPGNFTSVGATSEWTLLGDSSSVAAPTPVVPDPLAGPEGGEDFWGIRFIRNAGGPGDIYNTLSLVNGGTGDFSEGATPYLNYADLDGGQTDFGLFQSASPTVEYQVTDEEYLGSLGADDDIMAVAKATINIPAGQGGEWTFGVHSDDGFALKIDGAAFKRVSGASYIDPANKDTVFFRFGTGNSDARAVCDLSEGPHTVEFVWFEGGGGSYFELYAVPGAFNNDADTTGWRLVGGPEGLALIGLAASDPDFRVTSVTAGPGAHEVTLTFPSEPGVTYNVEWNTGLSNAFSPAGTVVGAAGAETSVTVNAATLNGTPAQPDRIFLRVRRP